MSFAITTETFGAGDQRFIVDPAHITRDGITIDLAKFASVLDDYVDNHNNAIPAGTILGKVTSSGLYGPYATNGNEVATVTVAAASTGGTFTITVDGATTAAIAFDATAAAVKAALEALPNVDSVTVTLDTGVYTITFGGSWAGKNVPAISVTDSTTGSGHSVTAATGTQGGSTASDGTETAVGVLFDDVRFGTGVTTGHFGASIIIAGCVREALLPGADLSAGTPGKIDTAGKAALPTIRFWTP